MESDLSRIAGVRAAWSAAFTDADIQRLLSLATDDIVVVQVDGRCVRGKEALRAELARGFAKFDVERRGSPGDISVHQDWAIEFSEIDNALMPIRGGAELQTHVRTVALYGRQSDGSWKVARVIALGH